MHGSPNKQSNKSHSGKSEHDGGNVRPVCSCGCQPPRMGLSFMEKFYTSPGGSFIRVYWSGTSYKYDEVADYGGGEILFWGGREFVSDYGLRETTAAAYYMALNLFVESLSVMS